ncbi:MAG: MBL fold metallo-hydrolase [Bacilli bacterium]|nr:MBL fold metallo-hydrolase [Bacilli bacterium]
MNTDYITINTQSSIKISLDKIIYFDPFKIDDNISDADIIFITHEHYDHFDKASIDKIKNDNTVVVAPKSMKKVINSIEFKDYIYLDPNEEINIDGINIKTIPAYNIEKNFHPRENNWLGYIMNYNNITYYIAGDTDKTKESETVKCDIAFIPIGGYYTMDVNEATELAKIINPKVLIPIHYGSIVGDKEYGQQLKDNLSDTNIEVIEKL